MRRYFDQLKDYTKKKKLLGMTNYKKCHGFARSSFSVMLANPALISDDPDYDNYLTNQILQQIYPLE